MNSVINIVIIGTGNVATHIAKSFLATQHLQLVQAFNHRNTKLSTAFAKQFKCELVTNYAQIDTNADVYIIAVKDDAVVEVAKELTQLKLKGLVVHTSGSIDMNVLKDTSKKIGVYYPLQTFSRNTTVLWKETPLLIECNAKTGYTTLTSIATSISNQVKKVNSAKRLQFHLAAVFASNFTNAMCAAAYQLIEKNFTKNDTSILKPLLFNSFNKLKSNHPIDAQTGPAMRNDKTVMKKHLTLLKHDKQLSAIYKLVSQLILTQQGKKV